MVSSRRRRIRILALIALIISKSAFSGQQEQEALKKVQEATYVQSGLKAQVDGIRAYGEKTAKVWLKDNHVDKEVYAVLGAARVYRDRTFSFRLSRDKRMTLNQDSASISISF